MASDPGRTPGPSSGQRGWWLEDAIPGTVLRHPGGRTIGATEHVWLAWITHNISDIHGDAHAATRNEWGQPLVLGMLTAAIVIGLAAPATPEAESGAIGMSDGWSSIRLTGVVLAGDTLRAESVIHAVDAPLGRGPAGCDGRSAGATSGTRSWRSSKRSDTSRDAIRDEDRTIGRGRSSRSVDAGLPARSPRR